MDTNDFRAYLGLSTIIVKNHRKLSIMNTTQSTSLSTDLPSSVDWVEKGGLCLESDYPYISGTTEKSGTCEKTCQLVSKSQIQSHVDVSSSSDTTMMEAIAQQPISVAIEADQRDFQLYKSGVFTGSCGTDLDHWSFGRWLRFIEWRRLLQSKEFMGNQLG